MVWEKGGSSVSVCFFGWTFLAKCFLDEKLWLNIFGWTLFAEHYKADGMGKGRVSSVSMLTSLVIEDHRPSEETQHRHNTRGRHRRIKDSTLDGKQKTRRHKNSWTWRCAVLSSTYSMLFVDFDMVCPIANLNGWSLVIDPQGRIKLLLLGRVRFLTGGCYCLLLFVTVCLRWVTYGRLFVTFAKPSSVCKFNWSLNGCLDQRPAFQPH